MTQVLSHTICELGEGAFWHPIRTQFFWFDILGKTLHTIENAQERQWRFDDCVSAAGWIDETALIIASQTALWRFDIGSGRRERLIGLEAGNPVTRSNDGRADAQGGFWIGTMGFKAEPEAGAIYRYYRGKLHKLFDHITIPNSICFSPDGHTAYFSDTDKGRIMKQPLDREGWPVGAARPHIDVSNEDFGADGSVIDAAGNLWNARWGAGQVACYDPAGTLIRTVSVPTPQASCPAFAGAGLTDLHITTAADGLSDPRAGKTYLIPSAGLGQAEHKVIL